MFKARFNKKKVVNNSFVENALVTKNTDVEFSESIKVARTNLMYTLSGIEEGKCVLVTSSLPSEGKTSTIINLAMEKGVKNVGNVNFIVEDTESICNNMMAEAVKIGKTRIEILAKAAGSILDKPSSINPYCSLSPSHVQPRMNKLMTSFDSAGTSEAVQMDTIEPGTINARASVNMVYYLK